MSSSPAGFGLGAADAVFIVERLRGRYSRGGLVEVVVDGIPGSIIGF